MGTKRPIVWRHWLQVAFAVGLALLISGTTRAAPVTVTFQQGSGGYTAGVSTHTRASSPNRAFFPSPEIQVDHNSPESAGLIRFDQIIGPALGQIPAGSRIVSAELTLTIRPGFDGGDLGVHQMLMPWDAATISHNNTPDGSPGIAADGQEAGPRVDVAFAPRSPSFTLDVTSIVQNWLAGADNYGFALLQAGQAGGGTDGGVQVYASELTSVSDRPLLTVTFDNARPVASPGLAVAMAFTAVSLANQRLRTQPRGDRQPRFR